MNWMILLRLLTTIPYVVVGIQAIHKEAGIPGITKRQLALDSLGLAKSEAGAILTGDNAVSAEAASQLAGSLIDQFVGVFKSSNSFGFSSSSSPTPTPPSSSPTSPSPNAPVPIAPKPPVSLPSTQTIAAKTGAPVVAPVPL